MEYQTKFNTELKHIIGLLEANEIESALTHFDTHLDEVKEIGKFTLETWNYEWRKTVYAFGVLFKKINPVDFLHKIKNQKTGIDINREEVLDFYNSEIDFNSLPENLCLERVVKYVEKYPYNPEFHHTLGHFYIREKDYLKAIEQHRIAFEKDNTGFKESYFSSNYTYLEYLIDEGEYQVGYDLSNKLIEEKTFRRTSFNNSHQIFLIGLKGRFKDYLSIDKKLSNAEDEIKRIITLETGKGQFKIIEILGFFTAIIAFIFSTVSIGKNFKFEEAIIFNIALGLTLMSFLLVLNLIFSSKTIKFTDPKSLMLIVFIMSLLLIVTKFGVPLWIN